ATSSTTAYSQGTGLISGNATTSNAGFDSPIRGASSSTGGFSPSSGRSGKSSKVSSSVKATASLGGSELLNSLMLNACGIANTATAAKTMSNAVFVAFGPNLRSS